MDKQRADIQGNHTAENQKKVISLNNCTTTHCQEFTNSISKIVENYKNMEKSIVTQLSLETPEHQPTTGSYREGVWRSLFEMVVPRKFCVDQNVFIIDSFGSISKEVDLAIFDEMYTPYIFNYGKIKFIPIEAVAVVVQCKSKTLKTLDLKKWTKRIDSLKTSLNSVLRVMTDLLDNGVQGLPKTQTATRPIRILCSTTQGNVCKSIASLFDIILSIEGDYLKKTLCHELDNYYDWYETLNHYGLKRYDESKVYKALRKGTQEKRINEDMEEFIKERNLKQLEVKNTGGENVIMSLTFQLNQLLMLLNNPIQFPHQAYVDMFNNLAVTPEKGAEKSANK